MSEGPVTDITDSQFEENVIEGEGIIIVDFWAPWCGPCHTMAPSLESFAKANPQTARVFKLDVEDNPKTAERYEIRSVPTVIYFRGGEPICTHKGAMSESALQEKLDSLSAP